MKQSLQRFHLESHITEHHGQRPKSEKGKKEGKINMENKK